MRFIVPRMNFVFLILFSLLQGCKTEPEPIHYGSDACAVCRMIIVDPHFGAELITVKGKIYKFDSIECMVKYLRSNSSLDSKQDRCLVVDHSRTGELVDIDKANFLFSEKLLSPMGESLSAFGSKDSLNQYLKRFGGQAISWNELTNRVK